MQYRFDYFVSLGTSILISLSGLLFIVTLINGDTITNLNGWTKDQLLLIYGYSMISSSLFAVLAPNLYQFSNKYIIQGNFDRILLRPLNSLLQVLFESIQLESLGSMIIGLCLFFYSKGQLNIELDILDYLWLIVSSLSGGIILISFFIILSSLSFHFEDKLGITAPFFTLTQFARYPLPIFNKIIQFILTWLIPFSFVAFYPATHFLREEDFKVFCYITPLVAVFWWSLANFFWKLGISKYCSTGS